MSIERGQHCKARSSRCNVNATDVSDLAITVPSPVATPSVIDRAVADCKTHRDYQHHTRPNSHLSPVVTAYGSMSGVREPVAVFFQLGGIVQLEGRENLFGLDGFQKNSLLCGSLHSRTEAAGYFRKVINTECV